MKWLITQSQDHGAYIGENYNHKLTIIKGEYPENYNDKRTVQFMAIDPFEYKRKQNMLLELENGTIVDDSFKMKIGDSEACGESDSKEVVLCAGMAHDRGTWRIKSVKGGFRIYNFDKCLTAMKIVDEKTTNFFDIQLLPCTDTEDNVWRIELMVRNILTPRDMNDKYIIHPPPKVMQQNITRGGIVI